MAVSMVADHQDDSTVGSIRDFSLSKYRHLCNAILSTDLTIITMAELACTEPPPARFIILRHDVDQWAPAALALARTELELGIRSTYYFRYRRRTFRPETIRRVADMGHEVGYHYEVLPKARGDVHVARRLMEAELSRFRQFCDVETASAHGSPLSRHDSRQIWDSIPPAKFGLLAEARSCLRDASATYFTDTGRSWHDDSPNLRDSIGSPASGPCAVSSTDDLISALQEGKLERVCISAHPERWPSSRIGWMGSLLFDSVTNSAKQILSVTRR